MIDGQLYIMTGLAGLSCDEILSLSGGMKSEIDIENRRLIYGENIISDRGRHFVKKSLMNEFGASFTKKSLKIKNEFFS